MKKVLVLLGLFLAIGLNAQTSNNCEKLKKENSDLKAKIIALQQDTSFLREKLAYFDKINSNNLFSVASFSSQFDIKVLSCVGDRGAQTVKFEYTIHHKKVNQKVFVQSDKSNAFDEIGNTFSVKEMQLGTYLHPSYALFVIPTDLSVRGSILFRGVIGGTNAFKLIQFEVSTEDADGGEHSIKGMVDIRNLKIDWL